MTAPVDCRGNRACYEAGCRRDECREAARVAQAVRSRAIAYGTWQPFTDAAPVRAHIEGLRGAGVGWRQVARQSGVPVQTIIAIVYRDPPVRRVRPVTAGALLAVRPDPAAMAPGARIDATGTRRRLQALVAIGHPQASIAARLGFTPTNLRRGPLKSDRVNVRTARAVAELYDELQNKPVPPSPGADRARRLAQARGWASPLAWDEGDIDDPAAKPADCGWRKNRRVSAADRHEEARFLLSQGVPFCKVAEQLEIQEKSLERLLLRFRDEGRAA